MGTFSPPANPQPVFPIRFQYKILRMRSILKLAAFSSIPLEAVNFWVIGYPAGTHALSSLSQSAGMALQWYVLHLPGIIAADHSIFLREHLWACSLVLFLNGYIDTAILLLFVLWIARMVFRAVRRLSSPVRRTA